VRRWPARPSLPLAPGSVVLQSDPSSELGGPLVDLNGDMVGITVAEAGSGQDIDGCALPVNSALAIATHIADQAHDSQRRSPPGKGISARWEQTADFPERRVVPAEANAFRLYLDHVASG
jgi:S1-C subfamily serine protease